MEKKSTLITAALSGMLAVLLGAFGAHSLKAMLQENGMLDAYQTAVQYQFYHTLALLATGILMSQIPSGKLKYASLFFTLGIVLFSGSLYVLSLAEVRWIGPVTPLGGVLFITGWIFLLWGTLHVKR